MTIPLPPSMAPTVPAAILGNSELFVCPACAASLRTRVNNAGIECTGCARAFPIDNGIPMLFWPTESTSKVDVTELVKSFYERTPFPNYDDLDSPESLRLKAERGMFARLLSDQIPYGSRILECGCGTGQLSNFLALTWGRSVFATDICLNSLRLGHAFKQRFAISNVTFLQMNLFRPVFEPESFDFVISNGVLHHTSDPFLGFQALVKCLKPGGFIVVGLYNTYGRFTTDFRRAVFRLTGDRFTFLDPRHRVKGLSDVRRQAWFQDQYKHPHESKHSIGEVLKWFEQAGVEFVNSIPKASASQSFSTAEKLFEQNAQGSAFDHFLVQAGMFLGGGREGGLFVMIGRKKS
jgi:SAM-dependent methyltransferase